MADAFDAFFGVGAGLDEKSQPMIDALRGQKRQGDILGLSTIGQVSQMGQNQAGQALSAGKQAGGLKMAREAAQRKKENEAQRSTRDHGLKLALQKERQADVMEGKQFDVDNRVDPLKGSKQADKNM